MTNKSNNDKSGKRFDIKERALFLAIRTAQIIKDIPKNIISVEFCKQLIRSSSSIGANLEEADGTLSKKDFINKLGISRRESRETKYWLKLIKLSNLVADPKKTQEIDFLIQEAQEITLILSTIINKVRDKCQMTKPK